jgi:hypothetical protein
MTADTASARLRAVLAACEANPGLLPPGVADDVRTVLGEHAAMADERDAAIGAAGEMLASAVIWKLRAEEAEARLAEFGEVGEEWRFDDGAGWFTVSRKPLSDADVRHLQKTTGRPVEHRLVGQWRESADNA